MGEKHVWGYWEGRGGETPQRSLLRSPGFVADHKFTG